MFLFGAMRKNFGNEVGTGASAIKRDFQPETSVFDRTILIAKFLGPTTKKKTLFFITVAQLVF